MYQKIVVKVGSNVLSQANGAPDLEQMERLVSQIARLRQMGIEVVLVSSGAVAFGRSYGVMQDEKDEIARRQVWASLGQIRMVREYQSMFEKHEILSAQVLVTRDDFRSRRHYLNMRQCLTHLTRNAIVPIVNENDVVSVTELMFTDNDELAGLVAAMVEANALIILTNVAGVYDGDPGEEGSSLIEVVRPEDTLAKLVISTERKSSFGRGGMITKMQLARKTAKLGIAVHIANGQQPDILQKILASEVSHTYFEPAQTIDGRKKWIAHSQSFTSGCVVINDGAVRALQSAQATSLLPVGITGLEGGFEKGDVIRLTDSHGNLVALGKAQYSSEIARERIGQNHQKPLVHYDYLYVL